MKSNSRKRELETLQKKLYDNINLRDVYNGKNSWAKSHMSLTLVRSTLWATGLGTRVQFDKTSTTRTMMTLNVTLVYRSQTLCECFTRFRVITYKKLRDLLD